MNHPALVSVVGARPQFVKAAIVSQSLRASGIDEVVIHTGQHYDVAMSDGLIAELGIDNIVENFNVGSASHAAQTAAIMIKFDDFLDRHPSIRAVLVYGDTNSTLAAGLVASKRGLPIVHVEAGLRSFNREMPEEINRVLVDHVSEILFCSSQNGADNLRSEGVVGGVHVVGDVMLDAFDHYSRIAIKNNSAGPILESFGDRPFALITLHRPSNTDHCDRFEAILRSLGRLDFQCLWPVHPRIKSRIDRIAQERNLRVCEPLSYLQILQVLRGCRIVLTDSGGLQKEAYWAKRPCVTLRNETEWTETVEQGWNLLFDPNADVDLQQAIETAPPLGSWRPLYGDGTATKQIAGVLAELLRK